MRTPLARVALFFGGYVLLLVLAAIPKGMSPPAFADIVWGSLSSLAVFAFTLGVLRYERRTLADVGLRPDARSGLRLVAGMIFGLGVLAASLALLSLTVGPLHLIAAPPPSTRSWLLVLGSTLALSCMEELGFRGYALRTLVPAIGSWQAQLASAVVFGALHVVFGWSWSAAVFGVIPSALLFGAVALRSGGLAMPIGLHAGVNLAQWMVGARPTSGLWSIDVAPAHAARVTTYAPVATMVTSLLITAAVAWWPRRARGG